MDEKGGGEGNTSLRAATQIWTVVEKAVNTAPYADRV